MEIVDALQIKYRNYDRQKCFVAHSLGAEWSEDLKSACAAILPKFNLELWYAADQFDPTQPLRDKVVELIANSRYGIYDISSWQDKQGNWQLPRNVFIELGIAIALNRPTLLLRHSSNKNLPLPACLQSVETIEFTGDFTLKKELEKRIPQWLGVPPDRDWLNRFCIFGDRVCSFREQHPCSQQWGQKNLHCHVADGLDKKHPNYCQSERDEIRGTFEEIFSRYSDLEFSYLDELPLVGGYQFLLCSHCQTVRSTPFAIYRISPTTSAEAFVAIGISIAIEKLFQYKIPKILLVRQEQDIPSLLRGSDVVEATGTNDMKRKIKSFLPGMIQIVRGTGWQSRPLSFIETIPLLSSNSNDKKVTLTSLAGKAGKLVNADRSTLWLLDQTSNELWTIRPFDDDTERKVQKVWIQSGEGFAGRVAASKKILNIPFDLYDHPDSAIAKQTDQKMRYRTCSLLCIPVWSSDGKLLGVIQLINKRRRGNFPEYNPVDWPQSPECWRDSFNRTDQELMESFGTQIRKMLESPEMFDI